jgi:hypothetical protein
MRRGMWCLASDKWLVDVHHAAVIVNPASTTIQAYLWYCVTPSNSGYIAERAVEKACYIY